MKKICIASTVTLTILPFVDVNQISCWCPVSRKQCKLTDTPIKPLIHNRTLDRKFSSEILYLRGGADRPLSTRSKVIKENSGHGVRKLRNLEAIRILYYPHRNGAALHRRWLYLKGALLGISIGYFE